MIDTRREREHVFKEFGRFHNKVGEAVIWFKFDPDSSYDEVYDEGGRAYLPGVALAILYMNQMEEQENYSDQGRRPTMRIHFAASARSMNEVGVGATEAHGGRQQDVKPIAKPWWEDRLNDLLYYDGRFYEISDFQLRGRIKGDVIVGISGIETQPEDEMVFDTAFPAISPVLPNQPTAFGLSLTAGSAAAIIP
jgi:hypothetical protein